MQRGETLCLGLMNDENPATGCLTVSAIIITITEMRCTIIYD